MASTMERSREESDKTFKLFEILQKYPAIWDVKSKDYKDRDLKKKGLDEISKEMDWTVAHVLEKYKNLRTYYTKEKRKLDSTKRSGSGSSELYKSKWEFFDALDAFLRDTIKVRTASSNLVSEQKGTDDEDDDIEVEYKSCETEHTPQSKRKRPRKEDELMMQALDVLKTPPPPSSKQPQSKDAIFAALIQSQLEDIQEGKNKEYLKLKIQQLIVESKFQEEPSCGQTQNARSFHFTPFQPTPQPPLYGQAQTLLYNNRPYNYSPSPSSDNSFQTQN